MNKPNREQKTIEAVPYGSHLIRLSLFEWLIVGTVVLLLCAFLPTIYYHWESPEFEEDYRMPYALSNDYWMYRHYIQAMKSKDAIFVLGDSVIWGEYVTPNQALPHYLTEQTKNQLFTNAGINGIHPIALHGLVRYYGQAISNSKVLLHYNPLWMSSPQHDLQIKKEFRFQHPRLVSQFISTVPCYRASFSERVNNVVERYISFTSWVRHIQIAYFNSLDIPSWTMDFPYQIPDLFSRQEAFEPKNELRHEAIAWNERGIQTQDFQWVDVISSLQWNAFVQTIQVLLERKNDVFVLAGPFNIHMQTTQSLDPYNHIVEQINERLTNQNIPYWIPPVLPSELYGDASHPLEQGYRLLAAQLYENTDFQTWCTLK